MPYQKSIIRLLFLTAFVEIFRIIGPYILKILIDLLTVSEKLDIVNIIILTVLLFLVNQGTAVLVYFEDKKIIKMLSGIIFHLYKSAHEKMISLGLGYHEKENTGNKIVKIQRGVDRIDNLIGNFFWDVAPTIFQAIITTIALFALSWKFGLMLVIFVPIFIFLTLRANKEVFPFRSERFRGQEEAAGVMAQSIININTVKSFVQEKREHEIFNQFTEKVRKYLSLEFNKIINFNFGRSIVIDSGRLAIMLFGVYMVFKGEMTVGSLVFAYTVSEKSLISLFRISRLYDRIMESSEAVERLYELSKTEEDIKNPSDGEKPDDISGKIEFKNVNFSYQENRLPALNGISFKINSGCVTALVGPSGGGKTTIARMIYRHYDPQSGEIILDGINLKEYDIPSFRRFIAIVPQEVEIFNTSVGDNISYAKPGASREEIEAAARIANADEFISQLKGGYDTLVGERGIKLSGGQRQRVGIARAILSNPRIIIFDEATSNLDSYSEKLIQEAIDKIRKDKTILIIAHRLSTIKKADKIIVLEKGRVVEEGSHIELSRIEGGLYQKLIGLQKMGDVD